ncbi:MAG: type II toxin-antitoxin system RelE/ParE family toxin [Planctomycetota bacterium]|nr:type II toxin-antitoxin system RelE/ParE family toxin [Planctomycetota bacterium]
MGRYSVTWSRDAENLLAKIWMAAANSNAVARAQHRIDRLLTADPAGNGREASKGLRRIVVPPLAAFYEIDSMTKRVLVTAVGEIREHGG